jgi:hypothetical protein
LFSMSNGCCFWSRLCCLKYTVYFNTLSSTVIFPQTSGS